MTVRLGQWSSLTRRWVLGVIPLLLALTVWWCYAEGTVTRPERVTVTRASMALEYLPPSEGTGRIGPTPGAWLTRYHVNCVTPRGEACRIEVSRLIDYLAYREGELISAEATFYKPSGVWALSDWGRFFVWLSLAAVAIGGLLLRHETRHNAPVEPPLAPADLAIASLAPVDLPTASLAPGRCALTSKTRISNTPPAPDKIVSRPSTD